MREECGESKRAEMKRTEQRRTKNSNEMGRKEKRKTEINRSEKIRYGPREDTFLCVCRVQGRGQGQVRTEARTANTPENNQMK